MKLFKSVKIIEDGKSIIIQRSNGSTLRYHSTWLRDNALDLKTRDPKNGQRLVVLSDIPVNIYIGVDTYQVIASKSLLEGKIVNEDFAKTLTNQNVLMFSKIDPFKLYITLTKNTVNLAARAGDSATDEIKILSGDTGIPAGPALTDFREAGVTTRIDSGNILVTKDSIVAKRGDVITTKLASLLSKLGLTPIKAGLSISKAYWNGALLDGSEIRIDIDEYVSEILKSSQSALSLAVDLQYFTPETSSIIIFKASNEALQLAITSGYLSEETIPSIISNANQEANSLKESVKSKGYN